MRKSAEPATALRSALESPWPLLQESAASLIRGALRAETFATAAEELHISLEELERLRDDFPDVFANVQNAARRNGGDAGAHKRSGVAERRAFDAAKQRCYNPRAAGHHYYANKGILVHEDWLGREGFKRFLAHIGPKPSPEYSLDRIDNNRGYEPGNVRWATKSAQLKNTSRTRYITLNGETLCVTDWALRTGIGATTIRARLDRGASPSEALVHPRTRGSK